MSDYQDEREDLNSKVKRRRSINPHVTPITGAMYEQPRINAEDRKGSRQKSSHNTRQAKKVRCPECGKLIAVVPCVRCEIQAKRK